jgi:hypothetical protein
MTVQIGSTALHPDYEEPVTVLEIDRHQARIDNGFDACWVAMASLTPHGQLPAQPEVSQ